jgi:hypothetical protein
MKKPLRPEEIYDESQVTQQMKDKWYREGYTSLYRNNPYMRDTQAYKWWRKGNEREYVD